MQVQNDHAFLVPGPNPPCFELSYPITSGMSGAPVFRYNGGEGKKDTLLGVCVGTHESRVVRYSELFLEKDGKERLEETAKIEEFGIAHDVRPLLSWKPKGFGGATLQALAAFAMRPVYPPGRGIITLT